jgi:hypothetical protein
MPVLFIPVGNYSSQTYLYEIRFRIGLVYSTEFSEKVTAIVENISEIFELFCFGDNIVYLQIINLSPVTHFASVINVASLKSEYFNCFCESRLRNGFKKKS